METQKIFPAIFDTPGRELTKILLTDFFIQTFRNGHCIEVFVEQVDHHHEVQMIIIILQRPQIRWVA